MKWRDRLNIPMTVLNGVFPSSLSEGLLQQGGGGASSKAWCLPRWRSA